ADGVQRYLEGLHGIGPELARRLVAAFGTQAVEIVETEPWRAAQVKGMGKRRAERAAAEAAARRQEREVMIFLQGLGVSLADAAQQLVREGALVAEGDALYLPRLHRAESELAAGLKELLASVRPSAPTLREAAQLSEQQRQAVDAVGRSGVVVITGGPGTGKT